VAPLNVAVLDFEVIGAGADPSVGEALSSVIQSALVRGGGLRLIERSRLAAVMTEQDLQLTDMVDPATAVEVGRIAGVDRLVLGRVAAVEGTYTVTCQLIDVTTGEAAEAEEFALRTLERYPQLGRLLAALISEQIIGEDSVAAPAQLTESFDRKKCPLALGISDKTKSGALLEKGRYVLVKGSSGNQYAWIPGLRERFYLQADLAQLEGLPSSGCGVVWGAQGTDAYLGVWLDGQRGLRLERRQGGTLNTGIVRKRDWPVLRKPPGSNRIRIESWDDRHRVFVNGVCVDDFYEPGYGQGRVGLRVFQREDGPVARWAVDNLTAGPIDPSLAGIEAEAPEAETPPEVSVTPSRKPPKLIPRRKRIARSAKPWAEVPKIWVTREFVGKTAALTVHARIEVRNRKGVKLKAAAQFFDADTGKPLKDRDGQFASSDGRVVSARVFSPRSRGATYGNLSLSIPLSQLHLRPGARSVKCCVALFDISGDRAVRLARSKDVTVRLRR
jgi:hypothetical protein